MFYFISDKKVFNYITGVASNLSVLRIAYVRNRITKKQILNVIVIVTK